MSLVGTRPPTVDEWDKYELHHRARLATKPGLTGMWQVSGRSNITDLIVLLQKNFDLSIIVTTHSPWENAGSAPFYKEWPVWVYVTDEKGNLIEKKRIKISLPSVLPGNVKKTQTSMETINLSRDVGDKYHLSIGIEDPMTGKANLRMTMKCKYNDGMNFLW